MNDVTHHYSTIYPRPKFGFPWGDARLDYCDLFAFPRPGDPGKSILMMDVHPSFDVIQAGPTTAEPFAPEGLYEIKIDTDGDAIADITYQVRFASSGGGAQTATLRRLEGAQAAGTGEGGQVIVEGAPVSLGREARLTQAGAYRFFAGWRSDPFFFDVGAFNDFQFVGEDFFADKDMCSIALEVPNTGAGAELDGPVGPHTQLDGLLYYDPTRPARYPDNGRTPSDDAPDAFLTVITNGKVRGGWHRPARLSARRVSLPGAASQQLALSWPVVGCWS